MNVEIIIKSELKEPQVVIYTNEVTDEIQNIAHRISSFQNKVLTGTKNKKVFLIKNEDIYCFYSENQKIYAKTDKDNLEVKLRLYEIEKIYEGTSFIRISKSCIVNIDKVKSLDISYAGTIEIIFKNGYKEFVSRRFISKIKKYLGI
ncbi:LytTR family DNA-binding domain-containing protein [Clostridium oceanicum]|uniref:LytTR family DNA-binding domain-containing protein n=1 Tax=Clostridium oceanicum TaxID=1543 RepID=A0ABN1J8Y2_9CLOT